MQTDSIMLLPLWYAVFLLSVTCHEAAHAFAAHRGGDPTAYLGGQVTLNPLPHVMREPFGTVLVPLMSFLMSGFMMGWASAPYDPAWEDRHPRRAAAMAAAGPLANLLLAAIGFVVLRVGMSLELWAPPYAYSLDYLVRPLNEGAAGIEGLGRLCSVLFGLNLLLFLFNLIPMPPLDGAAVLSGLSSHARSWFDRLRHAPMGGLIGLLVAWYTFPIIFGPVYQHVVERWLYP